MEKKDLKSFYFLQEWVAFRKHLQSHSPVCCSCGNAASDHCVVVLRVMSRRAGLTIRNQFSLWSLAGLHFRSPTFYYSNRETCRNMTGV